MPNAFGQGCKSVPVYIFLSLLVSSALGIAYNKLIRHIRIPQIQLRVPSPRTVLERERIHMAQSNKWSKALVTQSSVTKRIMTDPNLYTDGSYHQQSPHAKFYNLSTRGGVLEDVLGLEDVLEDRF